MSTIKRLITINLWRNVTWHIPTKERVTRKSKHHVGMAGIWVLYFLIMFAFYLVNTYLYNIEYKTWYLPAISLFSGLMISSHLRKAFYYTFIIDSRDLIKGLLHATTPNGRKGFTYLLNRLEAHNLAKHILSMSYYGGKYRINFTSNKQGAREKILYALQIALYRDAQTIYTVFGNLPDEIDKAFASLPKPVQVNRALHLVSEFYNSLEVSDE